MQSEAKQGISFSCLQPKSAAVFSQHSYLLYKRFNLQTRGKQKPLTYLLSTQAEKPAASPKQEGHQILEELPQEVANALTLSVFNWDLDNALNNML